MNLKIGDTITFHALCRWPTRTVTRTVNGFGPMGQPTVRFAGYREFYVLAQEISAVNGKRL